MGIETVVRTIDGAKDGPFYTLHHNYLMGLLKLSLLSYYLYSISFNFRCYGRPTLHELYPCLPQRFSVFFVCFYLLRFSCLNSHEEAPVSRQEAGQCLATQVCSLTVPVRV